jgi:hypothetical protein
MQLSGWASDALPKSKRRQVAVRGPRFRGKSMLAGFARPHKARVAIMCGKLRAHPRRNGVFRRRCSISGARRSLPLRQAWWRPVATKLDLRKAWHLVTPSVVLRGKRGTCSTGLALVARLGALGRAWAPVTPRHFAGKARHLATATFVSRGRTDGQTDRRTK